jgi:hypothetical protein
MSGPPSPATSCVARTGLACESKSIAPTRDDVSTWAVTVSVEEDEGTWWERVYDIAAPSATSAVEADRLKAREANPYAQAIWPYSAKVVSPGR